MNPLVPIILGLIGAVVSAVGATALARRQRSGKIDTSEAQDLWLEGKNIRGELREDLVALRAEVVTSRAESSGLRGELTALRSEAAETRKEMAALREESVALHQEIVALRKQLASEESSRIRLGEKVEGLGTKLDKGGAGE